MAALPLDSWKQLPPKPEPWPALSVDHDPDRLRPAAFASRQSWSRPFLLDDIDALLRGLEAEPAPLLADGIRAPVAYLRKAAKAFLPLPLLPHPDPAAVPGHAGFSAETRARAAWQMVVGLKLLEGSGSGRKSRRAHPGVRAAAWLASPREARLAELLDLAAVGTRISYPYLQRVSYLGDFESGAFPYAGLNERALEWLDACFARLESPAAWAELLGAACREANPFLADAGQDRGRAGLRIRRRDWAEDAYASLLRMYACRLAGLGALTIHRDDRGLIGMSLSPVGEWLYGRRDRWEPPAAARKVAIVGGDHTVTLLEPAPDFLFDLARIAEPLPGPAGAGDAYKLAQRKVREAAQAGFAAEAILSALQAWSRNAVPGNVAHEVKAWAAGRADVRLSEAVLVEGGDPARMAEILAAFPMDFERLSPTVLKAKAGGTRAGLAKALAQKGFCRE